jgi:hypothetical protein
LIHDLPQGSLPRRNARFHYFFCNFQRPEKDTNVYNTYCRFKLLLDGIEKLQGIWQRIAILCWPISAAGEDRSRNEKSLEICVTHVSSLEKIRLSPSVTSNDPLRGRPPLFWKQVGLAFKKTSGCGSTRESEGKRNLVVKFTEKY